MTERPFQSLTQALANAFVERRIYIRTDTHTRYFELGPLAQVSLIALALGGLGWAGFATSEYVSRATDARQAAVRAEVMREAYEARLEASSQEQGRLEGALQTADARNDAITGRLAEKQRRLVQVANAFKEAELELSSLREAHIARQRDLDVSRGKIETLEREVVGLQLDLARSESRHAGVSDAITVFTDAIDQVIADRDAVATRSEALASRVTDLESEIVAWEERQERVLSQLEAAARTSLSALEKVFERSDIDIDRVLDETKRNFSGQGGLFEPVTEGSDPENEADLRVAALMSDLERVNLMRLAVARLPYGQPVIGARRTSGFGVRRDPFRGTRSMHSGVDWAGPRGTPIYATANGVVVFAGRQSGYGTIVKIKHAFGFETFYAHLSRARVKVGQHVERGDRIADMGSTGRSTGTHLHYEIRIEKEPVNPAKFIEAARDVL